MSGQLGSAGSSALQNPSSASSASTRRPRARHPGMKDNAAAGQGTWGGSVINLVNTIVGAGVLAMPLALSHMGLFLGTIVILWAGFTAGFGLYLQTRCARYLDRGAASFFALSQMTYPKASIIFDAAIAIKCFGVAVSYLIIIGDLMPGVVQGFNDDVPTSSFLLDRRFWITAFMLIIIPFSFLRRLDSLKYTSFIALVSIGYLVLLVIAHFISGDTAAQRGDIRILKWAGPIPALSSLPVMVFAYTCHQNMFSILNEMKHNSPSRTTSVVTFSIGSASTVYILVAITGYLSFGDNIAGNIVGMYSASVASTIGRAAIVVLVMFSYPLQVHPCRASVDAVLRYRPGNFASSTQHASPSRGPLLGPPKAPALPSSSKGDGMGETRFAIITTVVIILSYSVAMTVSSLEKVLAYVGSTGSTSISFILPGLFYYKISDPESPHHQKLMKLDDDEEESRAGGLLAASSSSSNHANIGSGGDDDDDDEEDEDRGEVQNSSSSFNNNNKVTALVATISSSMSRLPKGMLRRASLALAIYGILVMVVCLITNTFFIVSE